MSRPSVLPSQLSNRPFRLGMQAVMTKQFAVAASQTDGLSESQV